ncbi:putative disease resistance protein RGA3 [Hibiscus syriacus]|uniref:putative disease resistance protein RGA3 n=1 Tax=Hibiscus syriacus TaxID=106335 RepID=UPI0019204F7D|nr:putative disease resistance protein RGA3 [Hibiscus syriacus]
MAEGIAFEIAGWLICELSSHVMEQLGLWWNFKDDLDDLKSTFSDIKDVLLDAEKQSVTRESVKKWLAKLKDAMYDVDDMLDDVRTEALRKNLMSGNKFTKEVRVCFSRSNPFIYGLKMGRKIKAIKARFTSIQSQANMLNLVQRDHPVETSFMDKRRQQSHSFVSKGEIIGRDDDKAALLRLLLEFQSEENVYVIPIVGIGGLGKTALAQLVYNDEMVKNHFELRIWVCVSDVFYVRTIVENIIKSVTDQEPGKNLEMDQLQKQLRDKIDGKKYLLVLDDIWNEERELWISLKKLLMGGAKGSRIIVTTRSTRVAKVTSKCQPHVLRGLSDDDAWFLFKEIAFEQGSADSTNSGFVEIGKQILERCHGVPLVIRTIASTLSFKETETEWLSFKDNELARISQRDGEILPTLRLSYDHLPSQLKHCFAYCRLYPKDHEFDVQILVRMWIALGFVKQSNLSRSLEEIGFEYFKCLVERSFFQEVEEDERRGVTCKMHDLMHDLAESVAGMESCILDSNSNSITSEIDEKCRHVSIDFSLIHLIKGKKLRSLLKFSSRDECMNDANWDLIISNGRCLHVLELYKLELDTVPRSIHKLKHLRYLDLSFNYHLKILPKSICKIQNLQVLKLDFCRLLKLPKKIENLVNLTHLPCAHCALTHMPRGIGKLTSLQTLSMFVVDKDGSHGAAAADLSELSQLNNLRGELTIRNLGFVKNAREKFKAANLKGKQHLRELNLEWSGDSEDEEKSLEDLQPHPNLRELLVIGWRGDAKFPSWISLLTHLVDIKIWGPSKFKHLRSFSRLPHLQLLIIFNLSELESMDGSEPSGGQDESESFFPSLKRLHLKECPNMKSWWRKSPIDDDKDDDKDRRASTMAFPCLSYLRIENCPLSSMPLYPSVEDELILVNTSSRPLKHTIQMSDTTPSTSSLPLSKLKYFKVGNIHEELDYDMLNEFLQKMTSLEHLEIIELPQLASLPLCLQHLVQLKKLEIKNCSGLRSLFPGFQHLTNLKELRLVDLPNLTSLPYEMHGLTSLEELDILNVPQLEERCRKDSGADWHKIAHIPLILVNKIFKTTLPCSIFPKKLNIGNNKGSGDQTICLNMKYLVRFHHFHSQSGILLHFSRHKPLALHFSSLSKSSKQTKKAQQAETCRIPSLFQEITDILGSVNVTPDETKSGFSITPRNTASELEFIEQSLSRRPGFTPRTNARESEFIKQSSSGRPDVYQNAQEKSELVGTEENVTALDDTRMGNSVEFDVSPVVHEITMIVRAGNASISMEEQLDKSGFSFEPEVFNTK